MTDLINKIETFLKYSDQKLEELSQKNKTLKQEEKKSAKEI